MRSTPAIVLAVLAAGGCAHAGGGGAPPAGEAARATPDPMTVVRAEGAAQAPGADLAIEWNDRLLSVAEAEDRFLTLKGVRAAAMMHLAMHDALNSIEPRSRTYAAALDGVGADPTVAAAQAAYQVAVSQYPDQESQFAAELRRRVDGVPDAEAAARGVALGNAAAAAILARRADDRWNGEAEYAWHPMAPGVYAEFSEHSGTPEGFVFGAGWAAAVPFMLESSDPFRAPPPPPIGSEAYTAAFREVKAVGRYRSAARTPDQTHLAMWWKEFVESSHNRLARELAAADRLDLWDAARMFALLNMSVYDAYVNVFDNKFFYNHWRPYTAIRWAAHDGNPDTEPDTSWTNTHRHTYAFPSYPSAHGCASAAAMTVLADTFGGARAFTMRIPRVDRAGPLSEKVEMDPPTRSFESFDAAAWECSLSRVYLGIHFRYDSEQGYALGKRIGEYAVANVLTSTGP